MNIPRVFLFDLDETIVFSEEMKSKAWTDILKAFGFCWNENEQVDGLKNVPDELRPKTGTSPHDFIGQLVDSLELLQKQVDLSEQNLSPNEIKYQQSLANLPDKDKRESMIRIMKDYWSQSLINEAILQAKKEEIKEVLGVSEAIRSLYGKGFRIGVTTQAPLEYAKVVLNYLGLIDKSDERQDVVDVIVSGDMVERSKPDPESFVLAMELIYIKTAIEEREEQLKRELLIKEKVDLGKSIYLQFFDENLIPGPEAVVGDSGSDIKAGKSYPGKNEILTVLINSRGLSVDEIKLIGPDIAISNYRELPSRLEGRLSSSPERHKRKNSQEKK